MTAVETKNKLPALNPAHVEQAKKDLEQAIIILLTKEPFYASLLLQMKREFTNRIPTAGVYVKDTINLAINPEFFIQFNRLEQIAILKHESAHVLLNHTSRWQDFSPRLYNVAADIAINQLIHGVPQEFVINGEKARSATIENYSQYKLTPKETAEHYYRVLDQKLPKMKMPQQCKPGGSGTGEPQTIDDHDIWKEGYANKNLTENVTRNAVNKAYKEAVGRAPGSIPAEVERIIQEMNKAKLDWKSILRRFVANSMETFIVETRKRRNRRFGIYHPGTKVESKLNIVEINDTSGSMSDEQLAEIYNELKAMASNDVMITSIDCDTEVHEVRKFDNRVKPTFKGGGGTDMTPALTEAMKHQPDCVIYFGDGYIPEPIRINVPMLWVINGGNKDFKPPYGKVVYMD
jgi:predicted metal-dependent peptidase